VDKFAVQSANLSTNKTGTLHAVDPGFSFPILSRAKIKTALLLGNICESRTIIKETVEPNNCHQEVSSNCNSQNASSSAIGTESRLADELIRVSKDKDTGHWKAGLSQVNYWKEALGMHNSSRRSRNQGL
jgi:hypothetical protein